MPARIRKIRRREVEMANANHDEMGRFSVSTLGAEHEPSVVLTKLFSAAHQSQIPDSQQKVAIMDLPNGGKMLAIHRPISSNSRGVRRGGYMRQEIVHVPVGEQYGKTISPARAKILLATHGYGTREKGN